MSFFRLVPDPYNLNCQIICQQSIYWIYVNLHLSSSSLATFNFSLGSFEVKGLVHQISQVTFIYIALFIQIVLKHLHSDDMKIIQQSLFLEENCVNVHLK